MNATSKFFKQHRERGSALVINVMLVMVVGGLGTALLTQAITETQTNANFRNSIQAFYIAKSGLEEARGRIPELSSNPVPLPTTVNDVTYLVLDASINPRVSSSAYYDAQYASEFPGLSPTVTGTVLSIQPPGSVLPYQWVRITRKTEASSNQDINRDGTINSDTAVFYDGNSQNLTGTGTPVYKLTSLAVNSDGTRSVLQLEGSEPPPYSADSAIGSQDDVNLLGSFTVSGVDYCAQSGPVYAVKTTGDIDVSGNAGSATGLTGPSPNQTGTYEYAPPTYDIGVLIESIRPYARPIMQVDPTVTYSASTDTYSGSNVRLGVPPPQPPPPGAIGTPEITYASGNLKLTSTNSIGGGILIVDGDLNVNGGLYYYGLIIVRGIVTFTGGGSNATNIYGAIVSGSSITNTTNVGGGVNVQFDSCAIRNPYRSLPLKILAFREITEY